MLDKWGVSNNNLTKKCEKDIRQRIEERKLLGKKAHRVVMNRSGKSLSPEKLNTIMAAGPTYFKGVESSSQRSVVVFSTPTPRGGCERNCEGSIELSRNMEPENGCAEPLPSKPRLSFEDPDRLGRLQADDLGADNNEVFSSGDTGVRMILRISSDYFMESGGGGGGEEGNKQFRGRYWASGEYESQDTLISSVRENPALRSESQVSVEEMRDTISSGLANILPVEMVEARPAGYVSYPENIWISAEDKDGRTPTAGGATESVDDIQDDTPLGKYARQTRQAFWDELKSWKKQAMEFVEGIGSISKERGISLLKAGDIVSMEWGRRGCVGNLPYHIYKQILDMDEGAKSVPTAEVDGVNRELLCQAIEENFAALKRVLEQFPSNHYHWESPDGFTVHIPFVLSNDNRFVRDLGFDGHLVATIQASALCIYNGIGMIMHEMALDSLDWIPELWMEPELVQAHNRAFKNMTTITLQKYGQSHPKTLQLLSKMARDFLDSGQAQRGELMVYGLIQGLRTTPQVYTGYQKSSITTCWRVVGDALLRLRKFDLVARLLVQPASWEGSPGTFLAAFPIMSCSHLLGCAYAELVECKRSLDALFFCFNGYRSTLDIEHPQSLAQMKKLLRLWICEVQSCTSTSALPSTACPRICEESERLKAPRIESSTKQ
ncbi:hypothetical protein TWF703_001106 [Orbilia oligospora]|uniref:Uncharacterized protein n=1 Tax=Orbilia oligospora TaxID=2813651 RepID=A0A7C8JJP9_ORBOL|nr:hypothetical protein TWF703_001106 [Orbilia oligospora]